MRWRMGPGLSVNAGVARVVKTLIKEWEEPLVLDADGLNNIHSDALREPSPNIVITPHVGELTRLSKIDASTVQQAPDRHVLNKSPANAASFVF